MRFNTLAEVKEFSLNNGFKEFTPPSLRSYIGVTTMFQKCYHDEKGKKYFINIKVWDWTYTDKVDENFTIEFEGQYYQKGTHNAVNFTFIDWTLTEVETWLDGLFAAGFLEHYELL